MRSIGDVGQRGYHKQMIRFETAPGVQAQARPRSPWEILPEEQQQRLRDLAQGEPLTPRSSQEYQGLLFDEETADEEPSENVTPPQISHDNPSPEPVNVAKNAYQCFRCKAQGNQLDLWAACTHLPLRPGSLDLCHRLGLAPPLIPTIGNSKNASR